jgi:glycosyltransferase involved in cell wall biosynthesis
MPRLLGGPREPPSRAKLDRLNRREQLVWARASAYVTITRSLAEELDRRYGPRQAVFVVPDGARPLDSAPALSPGPRAPGDRPVAAYAGHLYPWKGADVFVRALALAPNIRGLIVGGHPAEPDLGRIERLARDLGVGERLEITGLVPPPDVPDRLRPASMLVLPNPASAIAERYASPLKLFEYLWMNRPIVASDFPAIREVLTNEESALLVAPGDPAALGAALERLSADPALAADIAGAARRLAPEFTWDRRAARLEPVLEAARRS